MRNIKHIIEKKRQSPDFVWKLLVQVKDFSWRIKKIIRKKFRNQERIEADHFRGWQPKDGDIFLDIGARTGDVIGTLKQRFPGVRIKIVAIEPNPNAVAVIRRTYPDVIVVGKGVWNKQGTAVLSLPKNLDFLGEVSETGNPDKSLPSFNIEVDTLDNILAGLGISSVDFVKIDTEGAEPQVLQGFTTYRKGTKFHIEFHRNEQQIFSLLKDKGIHISDITRWPADANQRVTAGQGEIFAEKQ